MLVPSQGASGYAPGISKDEGKRKQRARAEKRLRNQNTPESVHSECILESVHSECIFKIHTKGKSTYPHITERIAGTQQLAASHMLPLPQFLKNIRKGNVLSSKVTHQHPMFLVK